MGPRTGGCACTRQRWTGWTESSTATDVVTCPVWTVRLRHRGRTTRNGKPSVRCCFLKLKRRRIPDSVHSGYSYVDGMDLIKRGTARKQRGSTAFSAFQLLLILASTKESGKHHALLKFRRASNNPVMCLFTANDICFS